MKWFKHSSSSRSDEKISALEDLAGIEGYGFYFKVLEVIAEVMDTSDSCAVTYSLNRWGRQLNITSKKFLTLSQRCADVGLMSVQRHGDNFTIDTPNLLKYRDNHTRNLQATVKQDKEKEEEKEEENKTTSASSDAGDVGVIYSAAFLTFWDMYPNKKNKGAAFKAFKKVKPAEYAVVKTGLIAKKQSPDWMKDNGRFIPHPASWLNARGWEDETTDGQTKPYDQNEFLKQIGAIPT